MNDDLLQVSNIASKTAEVFCNRKVGGQVSVPGLNFIFPVEVLDSNLVIIVALVRAPDINIIIYFLYFLDVHIYM